MKKYTNELRLCSRDKARDFSADLFFKVSHTTPIRNYHVKFGAQDIPNLRNIGAYIRNYHVIIGGTGCRITIRVTRVV